MAKADKPALQREKTVRQVDVARAAGVSQTAVSIALNRPEECEEYRINAETAAMIRRVADELGYRPNMIARQLAGKKSGVIGVLISGQIIPSNYTRIAQMTTAMERVAYNNGFRVIVGHFYDDRHIEEYVQDFTARGIEGVVCLHHETQSSFDSVPRALKSLSNVVFLEKPSGIRNPYYLHIDYADGIRQAVSHLVAVGRQSIGIVLASKRFRPMEDRLRGYREGLAEAGINAHPEWVWIGPDEVEPKRQLIEAAVQTVVGEHGADAILASNDAWALEIMSALQDRGKDVPRDVAVVGYDNLDIARLTRPRLTTIDHNDELIGQELMEMLLALVEKSSLPKEMRVTTVKPKLVVRESA